MNCRAIVMGGSAGGFAALEVILRELPVDFAPPMLVVQHLHHSDGGAFARHLGDRSRRPVVEACDKQAIAAGHVYTAPANYHMLVERGGTICLSVDDPVNWSRPSIDVLFESAARAWGDALAAVILSGANTDGTQGLVAVKAAGGRTLAQQPESAESPVMPRSAIEAGVVDEVLHLEAIALRLVEIGERKPVNGKRRK